MDRNSGSLWICRVLRSPERTAPCAQFLRLILVGGHRTRRRRGVFRDAYMPRKLEQFDDKGDLVKTDAGQLLLPAAQIQVEYDR